MKELLETYGWISIESKNKLMNSYKKEDKRLNHYFTTGTITIQGDDGECHKFYKVDSDEQVENIILNL
jgi:hypothetical protein